MDILTVVGARPQFIKAAAVSRCIAEYNAKKSDESSRINEIILHTGQHFDKNMSDVFFKELQIPKPVYNLNIDSMGHGAMTGRMMEKIEEILSIHQPDFVMVYGDTNSTLAGALAARKNNINLVHVEAGLRSRNMNMPEEVNRILTDRVSDILCCPTDNAITNLKEEGYDHFPCSLVKTGDVMQDAAIYYSTFSVNKSSIVKEMKLNDDEFLLCTLHRAENTDDISRLEKIVYALNILSKCNEIVMPLHPRTQKQINKLKLKVNFKTIDPVGYFDIIELLKHARIVMTDSGGLQKEAFFFKKRCVTLRDETEWVELVDLGVNTLVGSDPDAIIHAVNKPVADEKKFDVNLYGNGMASKNIIDALCNYRSS
ncbi:non-hydrolyzing UDP-N-acetylglucosamine 2-epimerase [Desulfogranum japonicum]|uniref:non-hydrolyzing UDP-N-acetylglucosamine 2-epimerase n=1 Tax=Desulfogranum japonicum TaxID=231447 RepID=UPI00040F1562|nr:UDP-N-acetylglucosamine 2-epimerase (non-hydrolyzing) [Desulfogranum japonicum]